VNRPVATPRDGTFIRLSERFPHERSRVWRALTDPVLLARWLMPNDFRLELGHEFTFEGPPIPAVGHDGIAYCRVLDFEPERFLTISFGSRGASQLASTITWTLTSQPDGGTEVTLLHHGFDPDNPMHQLSRRTMGSGWPAVLRGLGRVAGEL